jgi:DNA-binding CsgD family transcriptional regulator
MKPNHAIACLRQICCSGLDFDLVASEFLRVVPTIISSNNNTFSICDNELHSLYHLAGFDLAEIASVVPEVLANYHTSERLLRAKAWFRQHSIIDDPRIIDADFYDSDVYSLIYCQFDMHYLLWAPVLLDSNRIGVIGLYRAKNQKSFSNQEQTQLLSLLPYLSHAYQLGRANHQDPVPELSPKTESGILIMNIKGRVLYQSAEGKRLLQLASLPIILINRRHQDRLLLKLEKICSHLKAINQGKKAPPPVFLYTGPYGVFKFRAYWLDRCNGDTDNLIGITVEHQEPLTLTILRSLRGFSLSPVQMQVALLMAKGVSQAQISQHLGVKPSTVKDHAGKIYTKMNIGYRAELLTKLLEN